MRGDQWQAQAAPQPPAGDASAVVVVVVVALSLDEVSALELAPLDGLGVEPERGLAAGRAIGQRGIGDFLQHVLGMAAGPAFVGVNGHGRKQERKP
jgi:hypothetical protein